MAPNQEKTIQLDGRNFIIKKFTPFIGNFWAFKLFGNMADIGGLDQDQLAKKIQDFIEIITADHAAFARFQKDCLSHVFEPLPGGQTPVINAQGYFGIELSGPVTFQLTIQAFMYSISDFFTADLLNSLAGSVQEVFEGPPVNTPGSTSSSLPPSSMGIGNTMSYGTAPTP